jgi:hypothetical protein
MMPLPLTRCGHIGGHILEPPTMETKDMSFIVIILYIGVGTTQHGVGTTGHWYILFLMFPAGTTAMVLEY